VTLPARQRLTDLEPTEQYVGYIDILGWSRYVKTDFKNAVKIYDSILEPCDLILKKDLGKSTSIRIFSDAILLVSENLDPILRLANSLQFIVLLQDCLLRGGIARGKHIEFSDQAQLYVVSEPLVRAAELEKEVKKPCIVLDSAALPPIPLDKLKEIPPILRQLLFFEGIWIVNPFNVMWGTSAEMRVTQLKERYPQYSDKYDWFLRLYNAVKSGAPLVPTGKAE